jgi:threonylcarbamoyladenosine tRNA methylthiotransferase MtaB
VERGCREVVLTGVQIGAYGRDRYLQRGADLPPPGEPLAALAERLLAQTRIDRLRVSSIQPQDWSASFLDLFEETRMCPHLHLPLQSGSDATLRRMSRRYTTADFAALVERVQGRKPDLALTADLIAGFPGETDEHHNESSAFVRSMGFADAHVFRYSPRRGTAASRMDGQVAPEDKKRRSEELRAIVEESATYFRRRFVGSVRPVLWEEELASEEPRRWTGLTDNYLRVETTDQRDLLGLTSAVRLGSLTGDGFVGTLE